MPDFLSPDAYVTSAGRWALVGMSAVVGAIFGSFLNVVIYRLPRGMNLAHPPSQCPSCGHAIRWYDNVPVLGWLWLGGQCRDCHAAISPRYPLVEALVAAVAALLAWTVALPELPAVAGMPAAFGIDFARPAFDLLLMCTLIAAALIEFDGQVPPRRLFWVPLGAGFLLLAWSPGLLPPSPITGHDGIWAGILGVGAALLLGVGPWIAVYYARRPRPEGPTTILRALALAGGFLGERGVIAAGLVTIVVGLAAKAGRRGAAFRGNIAVLATAALAWIVIDARFPEISRQLPTTPAILYAAAAGTTILALGLSLFVSRSQRP